MATNKKTAKKTQARKVTKTAPKKCATRTCKKKANKKDEKHKFIIFGLAVILIILCGSLGAMTWARYAMPAVSGTASVQVAKWAVAVKDGSTVITGSGNTLTLTPSNSHTEVATGKIAPGSVATGSFSIDFTGTEVESEYTVELTKPSTLAATNAEITVSGLTCVDTSATVVTCTGHLSLSQISQSPIQTLAVAVNWDDHGNYDASDDDATDTADGIAAGTINLTVNITAKQAFDYNSQP